MVLTTNFTLEELTKSATAARLGIDNTPNKQATEGLKRLCADILQPIRDKYGKPIIVTSGYRCEALNKAVGGARHSQHMRGEAADIRTVSDTTEDNKKLFDLIVRMVKRGDITVGQLIEEKGYNWLHVSLPATMNKNQILHIK